MYTKSQGAAMPPDNTTLATSLNSTVGAPQNLGCDAASFSVAQNSGANVSVTVTFKNLINRQNTNNPVDPTQSYGADYTVLSKDRLLFFAVLQTTTPGVAVSVQPQALGKDGTVVPGPFLGPNTYYGFQAVVTVPPGSGTVTGMVVGLAFLSVG